MDRLYFVAFAAFLHYCSGQSANVWLTNSDRSKLLSQEPAVASGSIPGHSLVMSVDTSRTFQSMNGFGASITNSAAHLLYNIADRPSALETLFGSSMGIGLSYIRLVMGGSDFNAVSPYTYNDIPVNEQDVNMDRFTLAPDRAFVIPIIKEILAKNPSIKILATPWSPPAWMKDSNSLFGGRLKSGSQYLQALSNYFIKFLQGYRAEGIEIEAIAVQNEPHHSDGGYPTMYMDSGTQTALIRDFLGPALGANGFNTKIYVWDHNWDDTNYAMSILNDPIARQYVTGSAWHCYAGDPGNPGTIQAAHPDKEIHFTECSGGQWDTNFGSSLGWNVQNLFIAQPRVGSKSVMLWNMALDENHGPRVGVSSGCSNCRGVVTINSDRTLVRNVEYYSLGHFSKFVRPGALRLDSTHNSDWVESVAFRNTDDNSVVVVLLNTNWNDQRSFSVAINGRYYDYTLNPRSVVTFIRN